MSLRSYFGKYLVAELDGTANANSVKRYHWETFSVRDLGPTSVLLLSHHRKYLVAEDRNEGYDINANRHDSGRWEIFTVEKQAGENITLKTAHGRYVTAQPDGSLRGDRTVAGTWERFIPECVPGMFIWYKKLVHN